MKAYWITFTDGTKGCCEGSSAYDARKIAEHIAGKTVKGEGENFSVEALPYPASPVIWQFDHPVHGKTPRFCYTPEQCKGESCCRRNPCCTS